MMRNLLRELAAKKCLYCDMIHIAENEAFLPAG